MYSAREKEIIHAIAAFVVAADVEEHLDMPGFSESMLKKLSARERRAVQQFVKAKYEAYKDLAGACEQIREEGV